MKSRIKTLLLIVFVYLQVSKAWAAPVAVNDGTWVGTVAPDANPNTPLGPFELLQDQPSILISRPEYSLSWNRSTRVINWASWVLDNGDVGKTNRSGFKRDDDLENFLDGDGAKAVDTFEYDGSCLDRGHQVPSKDRTANVKQNQAVFKMSNMLPQTAFLNRIIWERLETYTRSYQKLHKDHRLWIIAGPIYTHPIRYIGTKKNIALPDANFKIIIDIGVRDSSVPTLIATVIMPNVTSKNTDPLEDKATTCLEANALPSVTTDWKNYTTSLDEIESQSGINLLSLKSYLGG